MKNIVQLDQLRGYDHELESARRAKFDEFMAVDDRERKRHAIHDLTQLTALRSPAFVRDLERLKGLRDG